MCLIFQKSNVMRGRIIILFMLLCGVFAVTNAQMKKPYEWKDYESVFGGDSYL